MAEKLPWLVIDMDEGLLRREPSRTAAVKWCADWYGPVVERDHYRPGAYGYHFGSRSDERIHFLFIEREDAAKAGAGSNVFNDRPKYPFPDQPYDQEY